MPKQQRATIILISEDRQREREQSLCVGKTAVERMMDDIIRRNQALENLTRHEWMMNDLIHRQSLNFGFFHDDFFKKYATPQHVFYLSNKVASSKAIKLLSALTHSIFTLYELARLFAALSLKTANYQRGISERIVESMTFKNRSASLQSTVLFTIFRGSFNDEQKRLFTPP
jgi:hypothetical protein